MAVKWDEFKILQLWTGTRLMRSRGAFIKYSFKQISVLSSFGQQIKRSIRINKEKLFDVFLQLPFHFAAEQCGGNSKCSPLASIFKVNHCILFLFWFSRPFIPRSVCSLSMRFDIRQWIHQNEMKVTFLLRERKELWHLLMIFDSTVLIRSRFILQHTWQSKREWRKSKWRRMSEHIETGNDHSTFFNWRRLRWSIQAASNDDDDDDDDESKDKLSICFHSSTRQKQTEPFSSAS
jgi:hypothetical protein